MEIWVRFLTEAKSYHEKHDNQVHYTFDTNAVVLFTFLLYYQLLFILKKIIILFINYII